MTGYLWVRRQSGFGSAATFGCYIRSALLDQASIRHPGNSSNRLLDFWNRRPDIPQQYVMHIEKTAELLIKDEIRRRCRTMGPGNFPRHGDVQILQVDFFSEERI